MPCLFPPADLSMAVYQMLIINRFYLCYQEWKYGCDLTINQNACLKLVGPVLVSKPKNH